MMKFYDAAVLVTVIYFALVAIAGFVSAQILGDDNFVEERSESILENILEDHFALEDGTLEDLIDLTPSTPEEKDKETHDIF